MRGHPKWRSLGHAPYCRHASDKGGIILKQGFCFWQDGEGEKQKSYLARCRLPCPVTEGMLQQLAATKDLLLKQTTPTRVEQRRAMLVTHPSRRLI